MILFQIVVFGIGVVCRSVSFGCLDLERAFVEVCCFLVFWLVRIWWFWLFWSLNFGWFELGLLILVGLWYLGLCKAEFWVCSSFERFAVFVVGFLDLGNLVFVL